MADRAFPPPIAAAVAVFVFPCVREEGVAVLIEGKLAETAFEVVSKKLVDIFGDKAVGLFAKKTPRSASMDAYKALRAIEHTFADIQATLDAKTWQRFSNEEWTADGVSGVIWIQDERTEILGKLGEQLNRLQRELKNLEAAFAMIKNAMEIYSSIKEANNVKIFILTDVNVLDCLFDFQAGFRRNRVDIASLIEHMRSAAALARETLSSFIIKNFPIEDRRAKN